MPNHMTELFHKTVCLNTDKDNLGVWLTMKILKK